jgi:hypothetical protein
MKVFERVFLYTAYVQNPLSPGVWEMVQHTKQLDEGIAVIGSLMVYKAFLVFEDAR